MRSGGRAVVDDPEVVEALRRELPLVVGELVASMETMDCEQARRGLAWGDLVARALGAEVVEAARGLKARLARECGRVARERGQLGVR